MSKNLYTEYFQRNYQTSPVQGEDYKEEFTRLGGLDNNPHFEITLEIEVNGENYKVKKDGFKTKKELARLAWADITKQAGLAN